MVMIRFNREDEKLAKGMLTAVVVLLVTMLWIGWANSNSPSHDTRFTFRLVTGTENRALVPMLEEFAKQEDVTIEFTHQGSVDTMLELETGAAEYDAVWPASSIWLSLGDSQRVVERTTSIMATPVVFAVKRSIAESLGWVGREVKVEDIMAAAGSGQIRYMTTSATQSNSGAMAYLGYLYAFAGQPEVLTSEMLHDPVVVAQTTRILGLVDRSAGASGFLRDLFLQQYDQFDGMFNNESAVITANQQLVAEGREPLYVIYPVDGLGIADWPLGYIDRGDAEKSEFFDRFQSYLLSEDVQQELLAQGRRTGLGLNPVGADPEVFNADWGIDLELVIELINIPPADVIREALELYQTEFRKPSFTVYCLDYSTSMEGEGEEELEAAMAVLLNPGQAAQYLLQPSSRDVTVVIPFNGQTINLWRADGNDPDSLGRLLNQVSALTPDGSTNIYSCVARALDLMGQAELDGYEPAIVLMTDGRSREGSFDDLEEQIAQWSPDMIPVYGILFGDASDDQLDEIAEATSGRVFDGRDDLVGALRDARANN